jgi:cardiolipin synthase
MELYVAQAIASAHQRVWITNPYFIPSPALEATLVASGLRGVDVRLLLPSKSDSAIVSAASRSYYEELLSAGVRIFEYQRGFVHAKTMVVDDWMATVGSANMDMRSFNLNFELNAFVFGHSICDELANHFQEDIGKAHEVELESVKATSLPRRLTQSTARLLSPLL